MALRLCLKIKVSAKFFPFRLQIKEVKIENINSFSVGFSSDGRTIITHQAVQRAQQASMENWLAL